MFHAIYALKVYELLTFTLQSYSVQISQTLTVAEVFIFLYEFCCPLLYLLQIIDLECSGCHQ